MRKVYLLAVIAVALLPFEAANAQPTLTQANSALAAGDVFTQTELEAASISEGPAGANQTWDFTQATLAGFNGIKNVFGIAGSPLESQYPDATVYTEYPGVVDVWLISNTDWAYRAAFAIGGGFDIHYTDPKEFLTFPFTYGSTFTDNFAATVQFGANTLMRQGAVTAVADGYGTLLLPNGQTHTNVLRVKYTEDYGDMLNGNPQASYQAEYYLWFKEGFHGPIFSRARYFVNGQFSSQSALMVQQDVMNLSDELTARNLVQVYPNPAEGQTRVEVRFVKQGLVNMTLVNSLGQIVRTQVLQHNAAATAADLSLDGLHSGIYYLQLQSGEQIVMKKIVVE